MAIDEQSITNAQAVSVTQLAETLAKKRREKIITDGGSLPTTRDEAMCIARDIMPPNIPENLRDLFLLMAVEQLMR